MARASPSPGCWTIASPTRLSKVPGIGDIPILGQLFRSKNLNHSVTELIVIVTPTVVDPLNAPETQPPASPSWPVPFLSSPSLTARPGTAQTA